MKDFKQNTKMSCEGSHYKSGGKVKKYADGGSANDDLQDLIPSKQKIGSALKSKIDPEIAYTAANPVGAMGRRIAKATQNMETPKSFENEKTIAGVKKAGEMGGMGYKKGGKIKRGGVKKYNEGSSVYADDKSHARGAIGIKEIKDPDIFTPKGKLSSIPIDEGPKVGRMPIPLSNIKDPSNYSRAFPAKKRGGKVKK